MEFIKIFFGNKKDVIKGEVFTPFVGKLVLPEGTITQYYDRETNVITHTEFNNSTVAEMAYRRGVGTDFSFECDGVVKVHTRFERTEDNPLNPPRLPQPKLLDSD